MLPEIRDSDLFPSAQTKLEKKKKLKTGLINLPKKGKKKITECLCVRLRTNLMIKEIRKRDGFRRHLSYSVN